MKKEIKWILVGISVCLSFIIILVFLFRMAILTRAGKFMAPQANYTTADVAILEGTEFIHRGVIMDGLNLLSSGKVKRLIVVLYRIAPSHRPFAFNDDYPNLVRKEIEALGLKESDFQVISVRIHHPVTLTAAKAVMDTISKEGVKSAILLSPGFHTRRSYLVYQYVSEPFRIKIVPSACFDSYQLERWWSQEGGVRDFGQELLKLMYYLARGHIPFKFSY